MSSQFNAREYAVKKLMELAKYPSKYVVDTDAKSAEKKKVQGSLLKSCTKKINDNLSTNFNTIPPSHRKRQSPDSIDSDCDTRKSARLLPSPAPSINTKHNTPICNTNQAINDVMLSGMGYNQLGDSAAIGDQYSVDMLGNPKMPAYYKTISLMPYERQLPCEILDLSVGDEVILVLHDLDTSFASRVVSAIKESFGAAKISDVHSYIKSSRHRVQRNNEILYEFPASINAFPKKSEFTSTRGDQKQSDIDLLWKQREGFGIQLDGYQYRTTLDLFMNEASLPGIEIWKLGDVSQLNNDAISYQILLHERLTVS